LAGKQSLPAGISDPTTVNTAAGALAQYQGARFMFEYQAGLTHTTGVNGAAVDYVLSAGVLSDEMQAGNLGGPALAYYTVTSADSLDARLFPEWSGLYTELQNVRGVTNQAIGALAAYDSAASPALRGLLYAYQAYADIMLADIYCSGVPLSTLDFNADFTYKPGSSTTQIYQAAVALFDTAIALSTDSTDILFLAQIGKGRALLNLGRYEDAAVTVANVPDSYEYRIGVDWSGASTNAGKSLFGQFGSGSILGATVADREGRTGLAYISSGDPRTAVEPYMTNTYHVAQYAPVKYGATKLKSGSLTIASGIEARLIQAEAALQRSDVAGWLSQLNHLRETAITPALDSLVDPGMPDARVDTMFAERAAWLFLTGERQGDMRRLIRNYGRDPETVYPTGDYPIGGMMPMYGSDVSVQIPSTEYVNPHYSGCLSRGA
jgi:tetratricopeptide (TPR) repeat protein